MATSDRMKSIAEMTGPVDSPNTPLTASERKILNAITDTQQTDSPSKKLEGFKTLRDMFDSAKEGSVKAREVEVAGEFEDMAMKLYQEAVEQGYKGTFFDFLIDRMDEEFDPASPMRVSRLKGIPSVMDMKMLTDSMPTGPMADTKEMLSRIKKILG